MPGEEERGHAFFEDDQAEGGGKADAAAIADEANGECLEHDHAGEDSVGCAHGFERAKVAEVFENEGVKGLAGNGEADDEAEENGRAKGNRDAGVPDVPPDGDPEEFFFGVGFEAGGFGDAAGDDGGILAGLRTGKDAGEHFALRGGILHGLVVSGEEVGIAGEGHASFADADNAGFVVVDFEDLADIDGSGGIFAEFFRAVFVEEDGVGQTQIFEAALDDFGGRAGESGAVNAHELDEFEGAVAHAGAEVALIKGRGPGDTLDGADAVDVGVAEGFGVVDLLDHGIDDPDWGADVVESGSGPLHDAAKDGRLFGHEQRGEGKAADEHDVFGAVAEEHFES